MSEDLDPRKTPEWARVRRVILERDQWECCQCHGSGCELRPRNQDWRCQYCAVVVEAGKKAFDRQHRYCLRRLEVDHIQPLISKGDPWAEWNLQVLCRNCHLNKSEWEENPSNIRDRCRAWKTMQEQAKTRTKT